MKLDWKTFFEQWFLSEGERSRRRALVRYHEWMTARAYRACGLTRG